MCDPSSLSTMSTTFSLSKMSTRDQIPVPSITNVATTVKLGCMLDPKFINSKLYNSEYDPTRLLGSLVIIRIRNPRTTAQIFRNGNMVCLGAKSVALAKKASRRFARMIQKLGYDVSFKNFTVRNLVGRCHIDSSIPLEKFVVFLSRIDSVTASWNPELFPSLTYRLSGDTSKVSLNVFKTGKVTITGAKRHSEMVEIFNHFYQIFVDFKRKMLIEKLRKCKVKI